MATTTENHYCRIELNGVHTRGQMVLDHFAGEAANVVAVTKVDMPEYEKMILWGIYGVHDEIDFINNYI